MANESFGQSREGQTSPLSQTGSAQTPLQVENIQYNVAVGDMKSKVSLAFSVSSVTLVLLVVFLALTLDAITGWVFGFGGENLTKALVLLISIAIPLLPLHIYSRIRLNKIIAENPAALEDVIFKKKLRRALTVEIILACLILMGGIFKVLSVLFLNEAGNATESLSNLIFLGGGFIYLALWTYSFQSRTGR